MLNVSDFYLFVQIVERGGVGAAGNALQISGSALMSWTQHLESVVGARLFDAKSNNGVMTTDGVDFYRYACKRLADSKRSESIAHDHYGPAGIVRITAAGSILQFALSRLIPGFLQRFPNVDVVAQTSDGTDDPDAALCDFSIREHSLALRESRLLQLPLASTPWFLFAGANYLERRGTPLSPGDLAGHCALFVMTGDETPAWHLSPPRQSSDVLLVPIVPRLQSGDVSSLQQAAIDGQGIVALPDFSCADAVSSGTLVRVLPDWSAGRSMISAVVPKRPLLMSPVRALLRYLALEFPKAVVE